MPVDTQTQRCGSARRTVAVVLAGGTGSRVGLAIPKQLLKVAGKPIIEHTLAALQSFREIDQILVMMAQGFVTDVEQIVRNGGYTKVTGVIEGGESRNESTSRAIEALGDEDCNVLFHDAVRPFLSHRIVADCVAALRRYDAVDVAIPSADTIIEVADDLIRNVPDRALLRRGQTPQAFRLTTIRAAYERAMADPDFSATDDCSVVLRYLPEVPIFVVHGAEENMKVTHPVDVFIADKFFQLASRVPEHLDSPDGYRSRLAGKTLVVLGGSHGIGGEIAQMARAFDANVFAFSRSMTGTHVEDAAQVQAALRHAHERSGRIDYVVNTAGVLRTGALVDVDDAGIDEMVGVNYLAAVRIAQAAYPYLAETKGQLLNYTSSSYTRGRSGYSLYSSTKAAVVNLTQALADEWGEAGIRVNCMNPERTRTPMRVQAFGEEPPESLLTPTAVALSSIDVLLSEITGQVVDIRRDQPRRDDAPAESAPFHQPAEASATSPGLM